MPIDSDQDADCDHALELYGDLRSIATVDTSTDRETNLVPMEPLSCNVENTVVSVPSLEQINIEPEQSLSVSELNQDKQTECFRNTDVHINLNNIHSMMLSFRLAAASRLNRHLQE